MGDPQMESLVAKGSGNGFSNGHRSMTTPRAAKRHRQIALSLGDVGGQQRRQKPVDLAKKLGCERLSKHVVADWFIEACLRSQGLHPMGVREKSAIDHEIGVKRKSVFVPK